MSERVRNLTAFAVIVMALVVIVMTLANADRSTSDRAHALATRLKCPVCATESIADSPSAIARDLQDLIEERIADGWSDRQIIEFFVATYGEQVLLDPPDDARTAPLWALPLAAAVAGIAIVVGRRAKNGQEVTEEEREQVRRMLEERGS